MVQQLYHGGQLELLDDAEGRFRIIASQPNGETTAIVVLVFERAELGELVGHLAERLKIRQPPGELLEIDRQGAAALEEAAARLRSAVERYAAGELNAGAAAELAGLSKVAFLERLGDFGVPAYELAPEQLDQEIAAGRRFVRPPEASAAETNPSQEGSDH